MAQNRFRRIFNLTKILVLLTAVFIALVLATGILADYIPKTYQYIPLSILGLGSIITAALASKDLYLIRQGHLLE